MDMEDIESCSICMDSYDEDVRPRCLPCGHSFCGTCIKDSIRNERLKCPHCQQSHEAFSADGFPISYGMEALISQIRNLKLGVIPKDQSPSVFRPLQSGGKWQEVFNDQKDSLRNLIANSDNIELDMRHYKDFIHQSKVKHDHILSQIYDLAKKHENIAKQLEAEDRSLTDAMKERKELTKRANETLSKYDIVKNAIEFAAGSDEVASCCNALEEWERRRQMQWPNDKTIHMSDKLMRHTTAALKEAQLDDHEDVKERLDLWDSTLPIMEKLNRIKGIVPLPLKDLQAKSEFVIDLLKKGLVYGVLKKGEQIRTGRISLENGKICLHSLTEEDLPNNARTIQHSELIESLNKDSVSVFMDLSWEGSIRGRLHILLSPDTPLARHFRLLCCGDSGSSYAQSTFLRVGFKGNDIHECVFGGDYEMRDGSGGAPVMQGLKPKDEIYKRNREKGILFTRYDDQDGPKMSQFIILSGMGNSLEKGTGVFGRVQEGLETLREAAKLDDISKVIIADCGVILNF